MSAIRKQSIIIREAWFRKRRHPICPKCKHDLLGTVVEGLRKCPECGREFEPGKLPSSPAPEDWTIKTGIERAAVALLCRSALVFFLWYGFIIAIVLMLPLHHKIMSMLNSMSYILGPSFGAFASGIAITCFALGGLLFALLLGFGFGTIMSRRITDRVGIVGVPLVFVTLFSYVLTLIASCVLANIYFSIAETVWTLFFICVVAGITVIVRTILLED